MEQVQRAGLGDVAREHAAPQAHARTVGEHASRQPGDPSAAADSAPMVAWPCHECEAVAQERRIQRAVKRAAKKARVENLSAKWK